MQMAEGIDIDEDGRQESGEPVVLVQWFGASRRTDVSLYRYVPAAAAGDPLGDVSGFADGWDMPGSVQLVRFVESGGEDDLAPETLPIQREIPARYRQMDADELEAVTIVIHDSRFTIDD